MCTNDAVCDLYEPLSVCGQVQRSSNDDVCDLYEPLPVCGQAQGSSNDVVCDQIVGVTPNYSLSTWRRLSSLFCFVLKLAEWIYIIHTVN